MAKQSKTKLNSESLIPHEFPQKPYGPGTKALEEYLQSLDNETLENETPKEYTLVGLRLIYPAHVVYDGLVTGKHYEWPEAGSVVMVNEPDVETLLNKLLGGGSCCGGVNSQGNRLFELA